MSSDFRGTLPPPNTESQLSLIYTYALLRAFFFMTELSREEVVNVSGDDPAKTTTTSPELSRRVKFEAFNRSYDLTLLPSKGLLSPHFSLMVRRGIGNESQQLATDPQLSRCFYRGLAAAFDLCQGMVRL